MKADRNDSLYDGFVKVGRFGWECDLCASVVRPCNMRRHREACVRDFQAWEAAIAASDDEWGKAA